MTRRQPIEALMLLAVLLGCLPCSSSCAAGDNAGDCSALSQLASTWNIWPERTGNASSSYCTWRGVDCGEDGRVESLCAKTSFSPHLPARSLL